MLSAIARLLRILTGGLPIKVNTFHDALEIRDTSNHEVTVDLSNCKESDFFVRCTLDEPVYINFLIEGKTQGALLYYYDEEFTNTFNQLTLGGSGLTNPDQDFYINSYFPFLKDVNMTNLKIRVKAVSSAPTSGNITIKSHSKLI